MMSSGRKPFIRLVALVPAWLLCMGCATAPEKMIYVPPEMLPERPSAGRSTPTTAFRNDNLQVAPVTGIGASNAQALYGSLGIRGKALVWAQTFQKALVKGIGDSHLFRQTGETGEARYLLRSDIQEQSIDGLGATFKVHYVIHDNQTDSDIFSQDIQTRNVPGTTVTAVITTYNTQLLALIRASGQNINALIDGISTLQGTDPRSAKAPD